jgi:catechol 2,3-dioxygenase-like lactoylglutathione lyase family enzyme
LKVLALLKVSLTVGNLSAMQAFYIDAFGFRLIEPASVQTGAFAEYLGVRQIRTVQLARGDQLLELAEFDPAGEPYPNASQSNDGVFQHCALATNDIVSAYERLNRYQHTAISRYGPQKLPGGAIAFKFRDPEGHPLEMIQFPSPNPATVGGIDHSAISVADTQRSVAFYTEELGLAVASRQVNAGAEQDALDDLDAVSVDVVGMSPVQSAPHVELLGYRAPAGRTGPVLRPAAIAATRLVMQVDTLAEQAGVAQMPNGTRIKLAHDPDGHALLLCERLSGQ